jgi:hypothetical protein
MFQFQRETCAMNGTALEKSASDKSSAISSGQQGRRGFMCPRQFVSKFIALMCVNAFLVQASTSASAPLAKIILLDPPGSIFTELGGINGSGQVTGFYQISSGVNHGFLRERDGTITSFDPTGSANTLSIGINSSGTTTGYYHDTHDYGFIRDAVGNFTTFDASVGGSGFGTYPVAINDSGEVVGSSRDQFNKSHSFLRDPSGNITIFDPPGFVETWAVGISPTGEIVGYALEGGFSGYVRDQSGTITTLTVPGHQNGTIVGSINRSGQIAGLYYDRKNVTHGFIRDATGNFTTFDAPGGGTQNSQGTVAGSINDAGEATGYVISSDNTATGFLRSATGTITLFRIPAAGNGSGQGTYSSTINRTGSVTGYYIDSSDIYRGFLVLAHQ